jgi:hypothetical protein
LQIIVTTNININKKADLSFLNSSTHWNNNNNLNNIFDTNETPSSTLVSSSQINNNENKTSKSEFITTTTTTIKKNNNSKTQNYNEYQNRTALSVACEKQKTLVAELLIRWQADANIGDSFCTPSLHDVFKQVSCEFSG